MKQILLPNHTSPETAYVVTDYPYGGLRCKMEMWIEDNGKKGMRFATRTTNPKTGRVNAPKYSTYSPVMALYKDEKGHVHQSSLSVRKV